MIFTTTSQGRWKTRPQRLRAADSTPMFFLPNSFWGIGVYSKVNRAGRPGFSCREPPLLSGVLFLANKAVICLKVYEKSFVLNPAVLFPAAALFLSSLLDVGSKHSHSLLSHQSLLGHTQGPLFLITCKPLNPCHLSLRILCPFHSHVHRSLSLMSWLVLQFLSIYHQKQRKPLRFR